MQLVVESGDRPGETFELSKAEHALGRHPGNDFVLSDPTISRQHCRIRQEGSTYFIQDVGSARGTYVNNERIAGARALNAGDVIVVGQTTLVVRAGGVAPTPLAASPLVISSGRRSGKAVPWVVLGTVVGLFIVGAIVALAVSRQAPPMVPVVVATKVPMINVPAMPTVAFPTAPPAAERVPITVGNTDKVTRTLTLGEGPLHQIAWSATRLAAASSFGIYLYDASNLTPTRFITQTDWVWSVALNREGSLVASAGEDQVVRLWNTADGSLVREFKGHTAAVRSLAFSPSDENLLASGGDDGTIKLWRVSDGTLVREFKPAGPATEVHSIAFSPDGKWLAAGMWQTINLWNANDASFKYKLDGHTDWVSSIAFSPDGKTLASGSNDFSVRLWDVTENAGSLRRQLAGHVQWVLKVAYSPDGQYLASAGADHTVRVWKTSDGTLAHKFEEMTNWVWGLAFQPQTGNLLAASSWDGTLRLWRMSDWGLERKVEGHTYTHDIQSLAFSPDASLFAAGSDDGFARIWHTNSRALALALKMDSGTEGMPVAVLPSGENVVRWVDGVAFSPDGNLLATGGRDNLVRLWRVSDGKLHSLSDRQANWIRSVAFSPDGQLLVSGSWQTMALWQVSDGKRIGEIKAHSDWVRSLAFGILDQNVLASGGEDGTLRLWQVTKEGIVPKLDFKGHDKAVRSLAFNPKMNLLASASDDHTVRLWNATDGSLVGELKGHKNLVTAVAFSPDGTLLASGSWDKTIRLWRVRDGLLVNELRGHTGYVDSLAFSPDGKILASGGYDGTIDFWEVTQK